MDGGLFHPGGTYFLVGACMVAGAYLWGWVLWIVLYAKSRSMPACGRSMRATALSGMAAQAVGGIVALALLWESTVSTFPGKPPASFEPPAQGILPQTPTPTTPS